MAGDVTIGPQSRLNIVLVGSAVVVVAAGGYWAGRFERSVEQTAEKVRALEDARKREQDELRAVVRSAIASGFGSLRDEIDRDLISRDVFETWRLRAEQLNDGLVLPPVPPFP